MIYSKDVFYFLHFFACVCEAHNHRKNVKEFSRTVCIMEEEGDRFRSAVDENNCMNLAIGKLGSIQVVVASYSSVYYYLQENTSYKSKTGEDESSNIIVMRIGVFPKDGKLILEKGFNGRTSVNLYKSSRHSHEMKTFFDKCVRGKASTITIWDRPSAKKESGYLILNYNCGIESEAELEQLSRLKDESGRQIDYLIIESSAQPQNLGMTVKRETKQTMLFGRDIDTFMKWISDISNFEKGVKSVVKTASSFGVYIKNCGNLLENEKGKSGESTFTKNISGEHSNRSGDDGVNIYVDKHANKDEILSQKHLMYDDTLTEAVDEQRMDKNDVKDRGADYSASDMESDSDESEADHDIIIKNARASSLEGECQSNNAGDIDNIIDITESDKTDGQVNSGLIENGLLPASIYNKEMIPGTSKEKNTDHRGKKKSKKIGKRKNEDSSDDILLRIANMKKKIAKMENKVKEV